MGKRSKFERNPRDFYPTPVEAVFPLLPHLRHGDMFMEPCAGDGALVQHLEDVGLKCLWASDIEPQGPHMFRRDALALHADERADWIITNPPWRRDILHAMIVHFSDRTPTWLLIDADWAHTKQAAPYLPRLRKIVAVGRLKWIPGSPHTGKENAAWHLFTAPSDEPTQFFGRAAQEGGE